MDHVWSGLDHPDLHPDMQKSIDFLLVLKQSAEVWIPGGLAKYFFSRIIDFPRK